MWRVYDSIMVDHDYRILALVLLVTVLVCVASFSVAQRALLATGASHRIYWIALAGAVTGVGIWTTHFTALLAYTPIEVMQPHPAMSAASIIAAMLLSSAGWMIGFGGRRHHPILSGLVVGLALVAAHYFDLLFLYSDIQTSYDSDLIIVSIASALVLSGFAFWLLDQNLRSALALMPALVFGLGILSLHFIAMGSLHIAPEPSRAIGEVELPFNALTTLIILGSVMILGSCLGVAHYDLRLARVAELESRRLHAALAQLERIQQHNRAVIDLSPLIYWLSDTEGSLVEIGPLWEELVGIPIKDCLGHGWTQSVHPEDLPRVLAQWRRVITEKNVSIADIRYRIRLRNGEWRWMRSRARPWFDGEGRIARWYGSTEDIDEQVRSEQALRASEERYRLASQATRDVIWDFYPDENKIEWSGAVDEVFGYPEAKDGTTVAWWYERLHPDDVDRITDVLRKTIDTDAENLEVEYRFLVHGERYVDVMSRGCYVRDDDNKIIRGVGTLTDVTVRRQIERDLRWAATHDPLTALPNRHYYARHFQAVVDDARKAGDKVGLVVIDIDDFKVLNDSLGHSAGDIALKEIGQRLQRHAPPGSTVARLGGDEYAIIVPKLDPSSLENGLLATILDGMAEPFPAAGGMVRLTASAGAAIFPEDGTDIESLMKSADLALYAAKEQSRGALRRFQTPMRQAMESRLQMLSNARQALAEGGIVPFYQPKVSLRTGEVVGFEALLRWHQPNHGLRAPDSMAAAFDDVELSTLITDRMLDLIIADMRRWQAEGIQFGRIAFNSTTMDFLRDDFAASILDRLAQAGLKPDTLELELTETVLLGQQDANVENVLKTLCAAGTTIALDDFGTGYASLTHLRQFPVDVLKIDRSFVSPLDEEDSASIVDAVINLGRSLGIRTVAEGVETQEQAEYLRAHGCDFGQGYLFSRPVPAGQVPGLFASRPYLPAERRWI